MPDLVIDGLKAEYLGRRVELSEAEMKRIAAVILRALKKAAGAELKALKSEK